MASAASFAFFHASNPAASWPTRFRTAGFSDHVELGDIGRIRQNASVALRVETLDGDALGPEQRYWRGLAFDAFDGRRWSVTPATPAFVYGDPEIGVDLGGPRRGPRLVQRIVREGVDPGVVFAAGQPTLLTGAIGRLFRDGNGSLIAYASTDKRVIYQVVTRNEARDLSADRGAARRAASERYFQLPALDPRVAALARTITEHAQGDAQRALALEHWLQQNGRYTDTPPPLGEGSTPVEQFLLQRTEGHCEYFASALVVLLRSLGIPARLVNGYAGGHENALGDFIEVSQSDAHAWVEVQFEHAGWVVFDPTPPDLRLAGADALRGVGSFSDLASAVELWWFGNVVDFDRGHQARALRALWMRWNQWRTAQREGQPPSQIAEPEDAGDGAPLPWKWLGALGLAAVSAFRLRKLRLRRSHAELPRDYARALRLLRRRGLTRAPATSARAFASEVAARIPAEGARAFRSLTEAYLAERFGGAYPTHRASELAQLRECLRRSNTA